VLDAAPRAVDPRGLQQAVGKAERPDGGAVRRRQAGAGSLLVGRGRRQRQLHSRAAAADAASSRARPSRDRLSRARASAASAPVVSLARSAASRRERSSARRPACAGWRAVSTVAADPVVEREHLDPRRQHRQRPRRLLARPRPRADGASSSRRRRAAHVVRPSPRGYPRVAPVAVENCSTARLAA
jgi:hypothetical protein